MKVELRRRSQAGGGGGRGGLGVFGCKHKRIKLRRCSREWVGGGGGILGVFGFAVGFQMKHNVLYVSAQMRLNFKCTCDSRLKRNNIHIYMYAYSTLVHR